MSIHAFVVFLLTGAIGWSALTTEPEPPTKSEKDSERLLEKLVARCKKMHQKQIALHKSIKALHQVIEGTPDKKPRAQDRQAALKLADAAKEFVDEADSALKLLGMGHAVAFPEAFQHLRDDMKLVQSHLKKCEFGPKTQEIAEDIAIQLKDMTEGLNKR